MIVALVPAHDEYASITQTILSLQRQSTSPDRLVVVADNCTDGTERVAAVGGAEVITSVGNTAKKAGALNQALAELLPALDDGDLVLVMDADSVLTPEFISTAAARLVADQRIGAVGGIFTGDLGGGLVGELQRNEFGRYARQIARKKGKAMVLTGTATLFRVGVLREVAATRGDLLPGTRGRTYDTIALTEDNEITLAIKTLGYRTISPRECIVTTEIMSTWGDLWRQRLRWHRGALENLRNYGFSRITLPYLGQQLSMAFGLVAMWTYLILSAVLVMTNSMRFSPLWTSIGLIFVAERVVTVWRRGPRARVVAAVLLPEVVYDLFQQAVLVRAVFDTALRRTAAWHHPLTVEDGR